MLIKNRYYLMLAKKLKDGTYEKIRRVQVPIEDEMKIWRGRTFLYNPAEISYRDGRKNFIFKDIDTGEAILQETKAAAIDPNSVKEKNKQKLVDKALQPSSTDYGLALVIIAAVAGLAGGAILMAVVYPSVFPQMVKPVEKAAQVLSLWLH